MIVKRRLFSKNGDTKKKDNKKELIVAGTGLTATGSKVLHDIYKDGGVIDKKHTLKFDLTDLSAANNTLNEVKYLKGESVVEPFLFDQSGHTFIRSSGQGQNEAAHNALKNYNHAIKRGSEVTSKKEKAYYRKHAKKQLKSAENHAEKAVEMLTEDVAGAKKSLVKSYKKLGRNAAIGLGLTAAGVAAINKLKNKKKNR
jgi:hypothetical protein